MDRRPGSAVSPFGLTCRSIRRIVEAMSANHSAGTPAASRILLASGEPAGVADVCRLLEQAGYDVGLRALDGAQKENGAGLSLVILDGSQRDSEALHLCQRLRANFADNFVPIIFIAG